MVWVNVGSGFEVSIGETAHTIADLMGVKVDIECEDKRLWPNSSEVERLFASCTKAEKK